MTTNVVNVKVKYLRPKYHDLQEWVEDPNNVYIGRGGIVFIERNGQKYRYPPIDSKWANPFKIAAPMTREDVINNYILYMNKEIQEGRITLDDLKSLKGKNLGCWCKEPGVDIQCHGDVLLQYLALI
jgi:hypothetical protein